MLQTPREAPCKVLQLRLASLVKAAVSGLQATRRHAHQLPKPLGVGATSHVPPEATVVDGPSTFVRYNEAGTTGDRI